MLTNCLNILLKFKLHLHNLFIHHYYVDSFIYLRLFIEFLICIIFLYNKFMISVVHFQIHNDSLLLLYSTSHHTQIQTIFVCRHFTFLLLFILVSLIVVGFFIYHSVWLVLMSFKWILGLILDLVSWKTSIRIFALITVISTKSLFLYNRSWPEVIKNSPDTNETSAVSRVTH